MAHRSRSVANPAERDGLIAAALPNGDPALAWRARFCARLYAIDAAAPADRVASAEALERIRGAALELKAALDGAGYGLAFELLQCKAAGNPHAFGLVVDRSPLEALATAAEYRPQGRKPDTAERAFLRNLAEIFEEAGGRAALSGGESRRGPFERFVNAVAPDFGHPAALRSVVDEMRRRRR